MSIYALSDLHADIGPNRKLIETISSSAYQADTLIVAGDIACSLEVLADTLTLLRSKFVRVCFVVGNHELWVRGDGYDSIQKMDSVLGLCERLNVDTRPTIAEGAWIVPLLSWYEREFGAGYEPAEGALRGWNDFHLCKWPPGITNPAQYFCDLNAATVRRCTGPVISFSHFLPCRELLPKAADLTFKGLPFVAGTNRLGRQIQTLSPVIHVYGHSHINADKVIGQTRFVQNALKYPRERKLQKHVHLEMIW